jgi:hypothetical protein
MRLPITLLLLLIASCNSATSKPRLEDIGLACDASHPCPAGTECGTCGIGTGQCIAPCSASGFGSAGGECPSGSFCSRAWSDTEVHICVRSCGRDDDCRTPTGNAGLSCNDPYLDPDTHTGGSDDAICNVSNSIGGPSKCSDVPH